MVGVRVIENPHFSGQPVIIGGVELITTNATQSSGVDAPQRSMESGAEITQRNVVIPEQGTIDGAVESGGVSSLREVASRREPISITSPEGNIAQCVVENVERTREGQHVNKFGVRVEWRQILTATVGTVTITAVTQDGPKSPGAGTAGEGSAPVSLVKSEPKTTSQGPQGDTNRGVFETVYSWFE